MPTVISSGNFSVFNVFEPGYVQGDGAATVVVNGFCYNIGGVIGSFATVGGQSVTLSSTNYVYLDNTGTLVINTTGFATNEHIALAEVLADANGITTIVDKRAFLTAPTAIKGLVRFYYNLDIGTRSPSSAVAASTNNNMAALKYITNQDGQERWYARPPQNYCEGDLTLRVYATVITVPGGNVDSKWQWGYNFKSAADDLGAYTFKTLVEDQTNKTVDEIYTMDFTMPAADFDMSADIMFLNLQRLGTDAQDDFTGAVYVHAFELRYTGWLVAGLPFVA